MFLQPIKDVFVTESLESRIKACTATDLQIREEEHPLLPQTAKEENLAQRPSDNEQQLLIPPRADLLTDP